MLLHQDQGTWSENKARREKAGDPEGERGGEMENTALIIVTAALPERTKIWQQVPGIVLEPLLTEIPGTILLTFKLGLTAPPNGKAQPSELGDN